MQASVKGLGTEAKIQETQAQTQTQELKQKHSQTVEEMTALEPSYMCASKPWEGNHARWPIR